ncbi:MAG TPA: phage baseplate assembly protein V [Caulobacteraceae bacterium]|nr:phage baseplate assembly protein V [Caulobacteraceae bacterium]
MSMPAYEKDPRYGQFTPTRYLGKYAGLVTNNDPPASGDHRGEVTVQVPGILEETPDGSDHQPLEVLAAPAFLPGFFFVPEVNDPVWVEFVAGDINSPIWTGVWYPKDATPHTFDGNAPTRTQRIIRTKSGHVVQLDDTSGSEQLVITDSTNSNTFASDANGVAVTSATAISLTYKPQSGPSTSITIDSSGVTITCGGQTSLSVTANTMSLQGSGATVAIGATVDVS